MEKKVFWAGAISHCDVCRNPFEKVFYDAATRSGAWACMCPSCQENGPGRNQIGQGKGQKYELQEDGRWLKTAG